jgi:hypothetical protein
MPATKEWAQREGIVPEDTPPRSCLAALGACCMQCMQSSYLVCCIYPLSGCKDQLWEDDDDATRCCGLVRA